MKKPRKQLLLLAALLVLTLTGCEAQDLLSTERFRFGGYGRLYDDGIPDYRSGTDGRFSS